MTQKDALLNELDRLPETLLTEVLDFVRFLRSRAAAENRETLFASEPALAKDWLRPEEDEAWRDL